MAVSWSCVFLGGAWLLGAGAAASQPHLPAEVADGRDGADVGQQDCKGSRGCVGAGFRPGHHLTCMASLEGQEEAAG